MWSGGWCGVGGGGGGGGSQLTSQNILLELYNLPVQHLISLGGTYTLVSPPSLCTVEPQYTDHLGTREYTEKFGVLKVQLISHLLHRCEGQLVHA